MDYGVGGEDDDDDNGDYDGTIMMTTMAMTIMTTMTMRMMKSRNIHPPQPRVGKEGSGRHLRYLILLQSSGEGGDCLFSHQSLRFSHRPRSASPLQ